MLMAGIEPGISLSSLRQGANNTQAQIFSARVSHFLRANIIGPFMSCVGGKPPITFLGNHY